jgi:hypothetical protein
MKWFAAWSDGVAFDGWREQLIAPLTPTMMKGASLDTARRRQAGFSDDFLTALREWHRP